MTAFVMVRIRLDARSRTLKASMLRCLWEIKGKRKKNITYYIYDLMRHRTLYGTILALFSNVTYHDKNVPALWPEETKS
jgi:hypothetical protein